MPQGTQISLAPAPQLLVYYLILSSVSRSLKVKGSSFVSCWRMKDSLQNAREFLPKGHCVLLHPASPWRAGLWYQKTPPLVSHTRLLAVEHCRIITVLFVGKPTISLVNCLYLYSQGKEAKLGEPIDSPRDRAHFLDFRVTCPDPFPPRAVLPGMLEH